MTTVCGIGRRDRTVSDMAKTVLLVEDDSYQAESMERLISIRAEGTAVVHCDSLGALESAMGSIDSEKVAVAICDLGIPEVSGSLDTRNENGLRAADLIAEKLCGVPVVMFSGSMWGKWEEECHSRDYVALCLDKSKLPELIDFVEETLGS